MEMPTDGTVRKKQPLSNLPVQQSCRGETYYLEFLGRQAIDCVGAAAWTCPSNRAQLGIRALDPGSCLETLEDLQRRVELYTGLSQRAVPSKALTICQAHAGQIELPALDSL